jgi:hypothetical protein
LLPKQKKKLTKERRRFDADESVDTSLEAKVQALEGQLEKKSARIKEYKQIVRQMEELEAKNEELEEDLDSVKMQYSKVEKKRYGLEKRMKQLELDSASKVNLAAWPKPLQRSIENAWPTRRISKYTRVRVLLVSWDSDDLNVDDEVEELRTVFEDCFNFKTSKFSIPDDNPQRTLSQRVIEFIGSDSPETLLLFYYAGHGSIKQRRSGLSWSP